MTASLEENSEREIIKLLRELAPEFGLRMTQAFTDWLITLAEPDGRAILVFGYDFGINSSSSADVARDKAASSHLLRSAGLPCVEQRAVFRPDWFKYTNQPSTYAAALSAFNDFGQDVVCKNNRGTGGAHVFRAQTFASVEQALQRIFTVHYACAISPFLEIGRELRVILVDRRPTAVFAKQRPSVMGDGTSNVVRLMARQLPEMLCSGQLPELTIEQLRAVPGPGELRVVNWRHNLGQGAAPVFDVDSETRDAAVALATRATAVLNLRAASVDVIFTGKECLVLEVNNGIMVENLARSSEMGRQLALDTYREIIRCLLT